MTSPNFEHDCDDCIFLGRDPSITEGTPADLYFCPKEAISGWTLIARFSDEGGDYASGACFFGSNPFITEAGFRAVEQGYISHSVLAKATGRSVDSLFETRRAHNYIEGQFEEAYDRTRPRLYRIKITSECGETNWLNVGQEGIDSIKEILKAQA